MGLVVDPNGDELGQAVAALVEHSQRAVASVHQRDRRLDDPAERNLEVELGTDGQDRVQELPKAARTEMLDGHGRSIGGDATALTGPARGKLVTGEPFSAHP
jgi:hypothetical protein